MVIVIVLILLISLGALIFCGHYPGCFRKDSSDFHPVPYLSKFPPILWLLCLWIPYSIHVSYAVGFDNWSDPTNGSGFIVWSSQVTTLIMSLELFVLIGYGCCRFGIRAFDWLLRQIPEHEEKVVSEPKPKWEAVKVFKAYLKARKEKVCPIIEIK